MRVSLVTASSAKVTNPTHSFCDAIKAGKLRDPVYTETGKRNNVPFAKFIKSLKTNQDEDEITPELLRKIGAKHASMVHTGKNYALGDPKSKKEPKSEPETGDGPNPQTQASSPASQSRNNDPKKSQTMDMDSMLAEIAMLAEIRK
ncbi:uncharacterized protein OCT59_011605 [Rhizophagus irregularis]|uniref:uncharacterized protein n=1 Tax=Rhizophagus irregularis TaxID=588596 RepID=UPI00332F662D|nr:hypothetical protein OCT59_011605 [Rhizophagus irregularis]